MAASKTEVPITTLVDKMVTKVQRLSIRFRGPATQWDYQKCCTTKSELRNSIWRHRKSQVQNGGLRAGST